MEREKYSYTFYAWVLDMQKMAYLSRLDDNSVAWHVRRAIKQYLKRNWRKVYAVPNSGDAPTAPIEEQPQGETR